MGIRYLAVAAVATLSCALGACATSAQKNDPVAREMSRGGPPPCTRQDVGPLNISIETCVQYAGLGQEGFGPNTLPVEMNMRYPYVVTVVDTPKGKFSNPLIWSVEVSRDGEPLVEQQFGAEEAAVETQSEGERVEIRSAIPLSEEGELVPGTYQFRYRTESGEEVGTTTVEVPESDAQQDSQPESEQDSQPESQPTE